MKDGFIRVECAHFDIQLAHVTHNTTELINKCFEAASHHTQVVTFPELCLTGYTIEDLFFQKTLLTNVYKSIDTILQKTAHLDMIIIFGAPLSHRNKLYNCALVCYHGEILGVVPKTYIPTYHEFYEGRHFEPALKHPTTIIINGKSYPFSTNLLFEDVSLPHLKLAVEICEDLWVPLPPSTYHALNGATLIVNLSASNELTSKADYRRMLVASHSARLICAYAYASAGSGESSTDVVYSNHHLICENGTVLKESLPFTSNSIYADVDLEKMVCERLEMTTYKNNQDDYQSIYFSLPLQKLELTRYYDPHPFVPHDTHQRAKRCEEVFNIQINGLIQRLKAAHIQKVVIGISGGLDSTLALLVAYKAFKQLGYPTNNIIAVTMPCFGTTSRTLNNALFLMEQLEVTSKQISIENAVYQHFKDIEHDPDVHDVTYENTQARERTQILMDLANKVGGIVLGTGDLSEVALGWSTYNGDHMSMYAINVSVPKTLVRYLVDYVSSLYQGQILYTILQDILDTPVSPELLPAKDNEITQKTEDIVGPYELHDFFLYHHARFHIEPAKMLRITMKAFKDQYDKETIIKWMKVFYRRFFTQQFKRSCIPDGPKVGSVALSPRGDLRMPSDANVSLWLQQCDEL